MTIRRQLLLTFALSLILLCGCGKSKSKKGELTGTVTYQNNPLTAGTVTIHTDQGIFTCPLSEEGKFTATDLPPGDWPVTVETESANPKKKLPQYKDRAPPIAAPPKDLGGPRGGEYRKIPKKYSDKKTSKLTVTVGEGKKEDTFELKD
jgi:hypothetical protein